MSKRTSTILIVPGYADSGPNHWQGRWLKHFPNALKVEQKNWTQVDRREWVKTLDRAIHSAEPPIVLVGHILGCSTILFWVESQRSPKTNPLISKIHGALLVAPPDPDSLTYRSLSIQDFDPLPLHRLPFRSILVASENDPFLTIEKARYFAHCLGSELTTVGSKGHIGEDSGVGEWKEGQALLKQLLT